MKQSMAHEKLTPPEDLRGERRVLLVGNFLSAINRGRGVCEELAIRLPECGWKVLTTSSKLGRFARLADMLRTVILHRREFQVAQVDVYSGPAFVWAEAVCAALSALGIPYVLALRGGNLPDFARTRSRRVRRLLLAAREVTAPSGYLREELGGYRSDILVLPNALDLARYRFRGLTTVSPALVWLRAFHRIYDPETAVAALSLLVRKWPLARLSMVGPDKGDGTWPRVLERIRQESLSAHVRVVGGVPKTETPRCLAEGDIFLNTSLIDNTPVTVLEAMASGLVVISTKVGGVPYVVEDGVEGCLVPPGDPEVLAATVARLLEDPASGARMAAAARRRVESMDWSVVLPQWDGLLRRVIAQNEAQRARKS